MSIRSMTGFGRGEASARGLRATVELSSVNRKQLEVRVNLPRTLLALESSVTKEIGRYFSRGHVSGSVVVDAGEGGGLRALVNEELAAAYVSQLRATAKKLGLADDLSAQGLLKIRGVADTDCVQPDASTAWPVVRRAMKAALSDLLDMRTVEGEALRKDVARRLAKLRGGVAVIEKLAPSVAASHRKAMLKRLKNADLDIAAADSSLLRELTLFADRSDISEELTRLESHLVQADKLLASAKPVGRSLDFLAQEMFREINTVGSKASSAAISRHVIMFKTELERVREQVQNIE